MRLKLDENLGRTIAALFTTAGHDVVTVPQQHLCSAPDQELIEVCRQEGRCLITLDLDFANPLVYKPSRYRGIAVMRLPNRVSAAAIVDVSKTLILGLQVRPIEGKLWTVQGRRIREYDEPESP